LLALPGVGPEVAGQVLISAGDNFDRIKSEAAFVHLCGAAPIPPAADAPTDTGSIAVVTVAPTMRSTLSFSAGSGTTHAHAPTPSAALTKVLAALGLLAIGMVITRGSNLPTIIGGLGVLTFAFFVVHSLATGGTVARAHSVGLGVVRASSGYLVSYYVGGAVLGVVATHIWSVKGLAGCGGGAPERHRRRRRCGRPHPGQPAPRQAGRRQLVTAVYGHHRSSRRSSPTAVRAGESPRRVG
jgi:hypothetical protein